MPRAARDVAATERNEVGQPEAAVQAERDRSAGQGEEHDHGLGAMASRDLRGGRQRGPHETEHFPRTGPVGLAPRHRQAVDGDSVVVADPPLLAPGGGKYGGRMPQPMQGPGREHGGITRAASEWRIFVVDQE